MSRQGNRPPHSRRTIGRAELEILNYINDHHPIAVREVAGHFSRTRGHVRTTVLNVMARLCRKGYLTRRKAEGIFRYSPRFPKGQLLRSLVHDFVHRTLGGSLSPFVAYLAQDADLSAGDVEELKELARDLEHREGRP
jgi:predicted transcriptional regulator